ncbi:hypothetical protein BGX31_006124 [Mortierella sp. GBA43]|nr:hypothetical protein BGX31_006124 [Mortierella sp. GBA43]
MTTALRDIAIVSAANRLLMMNQRTAVTIAATSNENEHNHRRHIALHSHLLVLMSKISQPWRRFLNIGAYS